MGGYLYVTGGFNQGIFSTASPNLLQEAYATVGNLFVDVQWESYFGVRSVTQAVTVNNQVNTAAAFDLGANTTGASRSTTYNSPNSVTVSGLATGSTVPWSLTNGFEAQVGGTGAWLTSGTVGNGAVIGPVRFATGTVYSAVASTTLTIGSTPDTWQVTVMDDPAAVGFNVPASQPASAGSGGTTVDHVGNFTVGGHAVIYYEPLYSRIPSSVTLIGAGASGADITLTQRVSAVSGLWRQVVYTCPDASPIVNGTSITIRSVWDFGMTGLKLLIGTLMNASNTVLEGSAVLDFPTGGSPVTTAAITIPTNGIGICFCMLNGTVANITATSGTVIATGIDYGGADVRGAIMKQITVGSWTPSVTFSSGSGSGLVALAWGP